MKKDSENGSASHKKGRETCKMKKKFAKRFLSWVMAAAMVISMLPLSARAAEGDVAQIGGTTYATLDDAIAAASAGDTIILLGDATLSKTLDKSITIDGQNHTVTSTNVRYGFTAGRELTFNNIILNFNYTIEIENPTYTSDLGLFYINGGKDASGVALTDDYVNFTFNNSAINMTNTGATNRLHAIYYDSCGGTITLNNSQLNITDFPEDAIEWGGQANSYLEIIDSTYTSDHNRGGIIGTWNVTIDNSDVQVIDSTTSGSNGAHFNITDSTVDFSNNASHGLSTGDLFISNSTVTANNNAYMGIAVGRDMTISNNSIVTVTKNAYGSLAGYAGMRLYNNETFTVDGTSKLNINNNHNTGLYVRQGNLNVANGAVLEIMNNEVSNTLLDGYGGGLYVGYEANYDPTVVIPADAKIYNNHATKGGDDIYVSEGVNGPSLTFGKVGSDWVLDDCEHMIDGWYDDAADTRWQAHAENEEDNHLVECNDTTITGLKALKAAHGKNAVDKVSYPSLDKQVMDNDDKSWEKDSVGAEAGETINFKLTSNVPEDLTNYLKPDPVDPPEITTRALPNSGEYILTFHDVMHKNLEDPDNFNVVLDREGTNNDVNLTYTLTKADDDDLTDGCTFEIELDLAALYEAGVITDEDIAKSAPIAVTYTATLNKDVVTGTYPNTAWVTYEGGETEEDTVNVKTYAIKIFKYDQADESKGLSGAEFTLKGPNGETYTATSGNDGYAYFNGLDDGEYTLQETKAPDGYVKSDTELPITIDTDTSTDAPISVKFANSLIPHTGGMGTTLFSIVGGALIATAGVVYFISRRKKSHTA